MSRLRVKIPSPHVSMGILRGAFLILQNIETDDNKMRLGPIGDLCKNPIFLSYCWYLVKYSCDCLTWKNSYYYGKDWSFFQLQILSPVSFHRYQSLLSKPLGQFVAACTLPSQVNLKSTLGSLALLYFVKTWQNVFISFLRF